VWAIGVARLCVFVVALVVGPQIADFAWDHGTHVTPAQMAMHNLLMADGIAHHHHPVPAARQVLPVNDGSGAAVQAGDPTTTFGSTFSTVDVPPLAPPFLSPLPPIPFADNQRPVSHLSVPDSPPPETLQVPPRFA
jgi:hypothetical protein